MRARGTLWIFPCHPGPCKARGFVEVASKTFACYQPCFSLQAGSEPQTVLKPVGGTHARCCGPPFHSTDTVPTMNQYVGVTGGGSRQSFPPDLDCCHPACPRGLLSRPVQKARKPTTASVEVRGA
jgi:hypothetical protein